MIKKLIRPALVWWIEVGSTADITNCCLVLIGSVAIRLTAREEMLEVELERYARILSHFIILRLCYHSIGLGVPLAVVWLCHDR
jgi:hypothetical protein